MAPERCRHLGRYFFFSFLNFIFRRRRRCVPFWITTTGVASSFLHSLLFLTRFFFPFYFSAVASFLSCFLFFQPKCRKRNTRPRQINGANGRVENINWLHRRWSLRFGKIKMDSSTQQDSFDGNDEMRIPSLSMIHLNFSKRWKRQSNPMNQEIGIKPS